MISCKEINIQIPSSENLILVIYSESEGEQAEAIQIPVGNEETTGVFSSSAIRLFENANYYIKLIKDGQPARDFEVKISPLPDNNSYLTTLPGIDKYWKLNFLNLLFYGNIQIWKGNEKLFSLPILVYPKKLKAEEAERIIKELLEWHSELVYDLEPTGLTVYTGEYGRKNFIQRLNHIRCLFKRRNLKGILNSIIENPHKVLVKEEVLKEIQDVETPACHLLPELATDRTAICKATTGHFHFEIDKEQFQFVKAYEEVSRISYDTYPNRFVKFFLKLLKRELNSIEEALTLQGKDNEHYKKYFDWLLNGIEPKLDDMKRDVNKTLNHNFFQEVADIHFFSTPPQTLLKEYRYQQIFSAYLDLIKGVQLSDKLDELLKDPIRNMPELYEYWCFLKLWQILRSEYKTVKVNLQFDDEKFNKILKSNSCIEFENGIILTYNRYYGKGEDSYSYSVGLRPDFTLETSNKLILFDAKYRVDWEEIKKVIEELKKEEKISEDERIGKFQLADLYKMHTYREAIRKKDGKNPDLVIILYPGTEGKIYLENGKKEEVKDFLKILNLPCGGVGAVPLRPEEK